MRPLPELTPATEWFWRSGADGKLRVQGCSDCGQLVHPPVPICPACRSLESEPTAVSGTATVVGFTVNAQYTWSHTLDEVSNGGLEAYGTSSLLYQWNPECLKCNN